MAGFTLGAEYIGGYLAAVALGIVFRYFAIAPLRGLGLRKGLIEAAKADIASLTALEIGLFGWMALTGLAHPPRPPASPARLTTRTAPVTFQAGGRFSVGHSLAEELSSWN